MVYIPKQWFNDPENEAKVHQLFEEYFPNTCVLSTGELEKQKEFPARLKELGELEILKRYVEGEIVMNG